MNFKTTAILLGLLVVLVGYLFFTRETQTAPKVAVEHKLIDIAAAADVSKVSITDANGKKTVLQKSGKDWRLVEPVDALAASGDVNGLVDSLVSMKSNNQLDPKEATGSKTGLDKPQFTVDLIAKDKSTQVQFGDKLAIGNGVYTKVGGKPEIEVVPADVLDKLDRPASAFRQLKLLDVPSAEIKQLSIAGKDAPIKMEKPAGNWIMTEPQEIPVEESVVTDLLGQLTGITATSFVENPAEGTEAMKAPALAVTFGRVAAPALGTKPATQPATQPTMTTVTFGDYDLLKKHVYVKVSDSPFVARVNASVMEAFQKKPLDFRDKRVLDLKPDEVSEFSITSELPSTTKPATLPTISGLVIDRRKERAGVPFLPTTAPSGPKPADKFVLPTSGKQAKPSAWVVAGTVPRDADESDANGLLLALHPLRVDKYLEKNPATQPTKSYSIRVQTQSAGGAKAAEYSIRLLDRGADQPMIGDYNGLTFELPRTTLGKYLDSDFKPKPPGAGPPAGGGFPGGGGPGFPQ